MKRAALILVVAVLATACGSADRSADVIARLQTDANHDVVVIRRAETDLTPTLQVCRVPHGDHGAVHSNGCAVVDPMRWGRASLAAGLDPGPGASLLVVVHSEAEFDLARPSGLRLAEPIGIFLPSEPIGSLAPLTLQVLVAESGLALDNAVGCFSSGLAGGTNPVFITASLATGGSGAPIPPPADLQTACF